MLPPLLTTTYFGPVAWYAVLAQHEKVWIEACETFQKQSFRNRCLIAGPNGIQPLVVPCQSQRQSPDIPHPTGIHHTLISDHGRWRQQHWNALQTAYGESPFFIYYADDIRPFFEDSYTNLWQLNHDIIVKLCELLDIHPTLRFTDNFERDPVDKEDLRTVFTPKQPLPDVFRKHEPYWQVFPTNTADIGGLSILDLLFNMGPEACLWLNVNNE